MEVKHMSKFQPSYVISKEKPSDPASIAYKKTVDNLLYANLDSKYKTISIIPTMKDDHQANVACNLGFIYNEKKKKTLLIDLDFRNPHLHLVLKSSMDKGIYDYLFKGLDIKEVIQVDKTYGFDYLLVGESINSVTQVLESNKLSDLIESLKNQYDVIMLISPSLAHSLDGYSIAKLSDGILYLVSTKSSNKQLVDLNYRQLKQLSIPILGSMLLDYKEKERLLGIPLL